ncbi:MAG: acyl-CoA dehydratase activase [Eggerthellaceae bacterium]|jgi:predicted CoA-substrate-specific enzyme activase|nr:acyl-CoA dehydratase activase [Eggerthellaceae bacterium]MCH4221225.1 acyl-CoA dehydratase activase [Eggerthellaceae bacterium]
MEQHYMGIDVGSTATKAVVIDDAKNIVATKLCPTGFSGIDAAQRVADSYAQDGINVADIPVAATGYGRVSVPFADHVITEITCHGRGAAALFGADGIVIDVGGQDTKIIQVCNGSVKKFAMNDKCAAGTGKFLEVMANRMGVSQQNLSELARQGAPTTISCTCTVFAESEVISLIGQGCNRADIAQGVIESVVVRVVSLAAQVPGSPYFLTGGLCENEYIVERLSAHLHQPVTTLPQARYAGALGAALCARDRSKR